MTQGQPADPSASPPGVDPQFGSTVTIFFSDIRGFTEYTDQHGDAAAYRMLQMHNSVLVEKLALYRGHVVKTQGDSFMVSFESARTAVTCAIAIQREFDKLHSQQQGPTIQVGIGINLGEPVREGDDYFGGTVNLAARICGIAEPGQILVSETVRSVVGKMEGTSFVDHGLYEIKGFQASQRLFRVDWDAADQRVAAPMVVKGAPSVEKKGHPVSASTAAAVSSYTESSPQSPLASPLVAPPIGAQPRARRRVEPPMVLIALFIAAVLVISGVIGTIALIRHNGNNGAANQAANRSSGSPTPSAGSGLPAPTGAVTLVRDLPTKSRAFDSRDPVSFNTQVMLDSLGFVNHNPQALFVPKEADYDLSGRFARFQAQVLMDDQSNVGQARFTVFGDDQLLGDVIVDKGASKNLDVVVTGVQSLSLVATLPPSAGCCFSGDFVSARLYAAPTVATSPAPPTLKSLVLAGDGPDYVGPVQASGRPYIDAVALGLTNPEAQPQLKQIKYTLGGRYQRLKLTEIVTDDSGANFQIRFVVAADGTSISDKNLSTGDTSDLDLKVSGVQTITLIVNASGCCGSAAFASSALS
jgi:class 3 adenylate cyclase